MLPATERLLRPGVLKPIFLMISLGNPPPLEKTRHSVGHMALDALQVTLDDQPGWTQQRYSSPGAMASASISAWGDYTLLKCPTFMNTSGKWAAQAVAAACERHPANPILACIVHDELELPPAKVKVRSWDKSPAGHNGLKSCRKSMGQAKGHNGYYRIGVGIGRPESRDPVDVSKYVLGHMPHDHKRKYDNIGTEIVGMMEEVVKRWQADQAKHMGP